MSKEAYTALVIMGLSFIQFESLFSLSVVVFQTVGRSVHNEQPTTSTIQQTSSRYSLEHAHAPHFYFSNWSWIHIFVFRITNGFLFSVHFFFNHYNKSIRLPRYVSIGIRVFLKNWVAYKLKRMMLLCMFSRVLFCFLLNSCHFQYYKLFIMYVLCECVRVSRICIDKQNSPK